MDPAGSPQIIECELRLHSDRPVDPPGGAAAWGEWSATTVGEPVIFRAVAVTSEGAWNGPLAPGVEIAAPVALDDPWWTIFLPDSKGRPVFADRVGRRLAIGENFSLPAGQPGIWTNGVVFDGAVVIE